MKQHSYNYKKSAIKYYKIIKSFRKVCKIYGCSKSSLQRWIKRLNNKNLERKKRKNKYIISEKEKDFIKEYIKNNPNTTVEIIKNEINKKFKQNYNYSKIYNLIKELKISYKKLRLKYFPKKGNEKEELCIFYKYFINENINNIISLDETAIYVNMIKTYGYSKKGKRAYYKTSIYPYKKYNLLCAIKNNKIIGSEIYETSLDKEKFILFIDKYIKNQYINNILLMDNAKFHHNKDVKEYIKNINNKILYTIRYHPENNPIENFFNQIKHYIKLKSPTNLEDIKKELVNIYKTKIKEKHLNNYFNHVKMRGLVYLKKC
jgi:transposase